VAVWTSMTSMIRSHGRFVDRCTTSNGRICYCILALELLTSLIRKWNPLKKGVELGTYWIKLRILVYFMENPYL
jgi:hypothetical protein